MSRHVQTPSHPIIVVTGANSGIGFAICQRLLAQLSSPWPSDALARDNLSGAPQQQSPFAPTKQLTLVLACRNAKRASAARSRLLNFLDVQLSRQRNSAGHNAHGDDFRRGLNIDFLPVDLASVDSVIEFAKLARRQYPYITHLILNAGVCDILAFDFNLAFRQFLRSFVDAVTFPRFMIQPVGLESRDGLGLIWQSNVFGHYCLARLMEPLLLANPYLDSRVQWMSSIHTEPFDPSDPQLRQTKKPYETSKHQIDLVATAFARTTAKDDIQQDRARISHVLIQPGVCHTELTLKVLGWFMAIFKVVAFYVGRMLGSQNHLIKPYKSAIVATHTALAPAPLLQDNRPPQKFNARCTMFGREYVDVNSFPNWEEQEGRVDDIAKLCENLFQTFMKARGATPATDSGVELGQDTL